MSQLQKRQIIFSLLLLSFAVTVGCKGYSLTGGPAAAAAGPLSVSATVDYRPDAYQSLVIFPLTNGVGLELSSEQLNGLTKIAIAEVDSATDKTVLNISEQNQIAKGLAVALDQKNPLAAQALRAGKEAKAQAVLFGTVTRFADFKEGVSPTSSIRFAGSFDGDVHSPQSESRGNLVSSTATLPGGVGFKLSLLDVRTGQVVWMASFDLEGGTASENLFKIKENLEYAAAGPTKLEDIFRRAIRKAVREIDNFTN